MDIPVKLYGARIFRKNWSSVAERFNLLELQYYDTVNNQHLYYLIENPRYGYKFDSELKFVDTFYRLSQEEKDKVHGLIDKLYEGQPEYVFYYDEQSEWEDYIEEAHGVMFGWIPVPSIKNYYVKRKSEALKLIKKEKIESVLEEIESYERTIKMYTDDLEKATKSYKEKKDTLVKEPVIGTKFYKFIRSFGVMSYEVIAFEKHGDLDLLRLKCTSCTHGAENCEVYIIYSAYNYYNFVKVINNSDHKHLHSSAGLFHTSEKTAFKEYFESIEIKNNQVIQDYKERIYQLRKLLD